MAELDMLLQEIPLIQGFSPTKFEQIVDFQILKKAGVYDITKMRIITLMVAMFNHSNKWTGKAVMANAEKHGLIPQEQAGSQKRQRANYTALEKCLGSSAG